MQNENIISNELVLNNDASLKEYYIRLQSLYNNAVNMLTALNQSLYSNTAQIEVSISDTTNASSTVRIPSFLYLESKLEELSSNIDAIFNIPKDGEAWFTKSENMYKLNLVRSNIAPITPSFNLLNNTLYSGFTDNNIFKDMVLPKMFIKIPLTNLPSNASKLLMRKIVVNDGQVFESIKNISTLKDVNNKYYEISYEECKARLYNLTKGVDYTEYESVLDLPIKKDYYNSSFKITEVSNKWIATIDGEEKETYEVKLDTLTYSNEEDSAIQYTLKEGDKLCLGNEMTVFKIKSILYDNTVQLEQYIGYTALDTFAENSQMIFKIYVDDYSKFNYVDIPLEENQYVIIFLSTIWNNVRSIFSDGILLDLSTINIKDEYGNLIYDTTGKAYNYLSYYNTFCNNIGDIFAGISKTIYSQISNYTTDQLNQLTNSNAIKEQVSATINNDVLKVIAINNHLTDDLDTEEILNLHTQKNEINSKLQTCQSNIDQVYSTLLNTDFSQNVTVTQVSLQEKINGYYTERNELQKQMIAIVDNINSRVSTTTNTEQLKYRIRGIASTNLLSEYLSNTFTNVEIIGIDVEYKYKSTNKDTETISIINNAVFTDWNKLMTIDKERKLVFTNNESFYIQYVDYSDTVNVIKWNQIDIPIKYGEDVDIRVRYKYSVGQPFITLYTPWSDSLTVVFPTEFSENMELTSVIETNSKDTITAAFNKTLIDEGYAEHIQNKVLSNEQVFFHMPENIYSGFNTAENNLISLKDKLNQMANDIETYKSFIDDLTNTKYEIYLGYDNNSVLLTDNAINSINIYNTEHITDLFIKKDINLVIKNTGNASLKLYSLFPGSTSEYLITNNSENYIPTKGNYERVPLYVGNTLTGQTLNQFIYFRSTNPYTGADIYYNTIEQNAYDFAAAISTNANARPTFTDENVLKYIDKDNKQILLAFRNNAYISGFNYNSIESENDVEDFIKKYTNVKTNEKLQDIAWFIYPQYISPAALVNSDNLDEKNKYVGRFEDFVLSDESSDNHFFMDVKTSMSLLKDALKGNSENNISLSGGFLYPNILSKTQITLNDKELYKTVKPGESLTIPIVFEFYLEHGKSTITKSLYFDIKTSTISDPVHYMIEITGNYDYSTSGNIYKNIDDESSFSSTLE